MYIYIYIYILSGCPQAARTRGLHAAKHARAIITTTTTITLMITVSTLIRTVTLINTAFVAKPNNNKH